MPVKRDARTGRWFFRAVVKYPDGRRERIFGTPGVPGAYQDLANTKAGAIEAENRAKANALHGKPSTPTINERREVPTLNEYAEIFLANYLPGQKPSERKEKGKVLKGQLLPAFGSMRLDAIRQVDVDAFVARELRRKSRKTGLPVSRKTVNNRLAVLSTLLRYAHENELIAEPTLRYFVGGGIKAKDAQVLPVSVDDVAKLLAAARDQRFRVAVLLAAEAGLRVGEIRGLQWGDIRDGVLRVARAVDLDGNVGLPKHDKQRTVPLSETLKVALRDLPRRGLWVVSDREGGMLGYYAARDALHALYDAAAVKPPVSDAGISMPWHSLRHTFGTECAARGVPLPVIQELMGHADIKTTLRYVTVSETQKHDAIALAFGRGSHVAATSKTNRQPGEK
jgi:integrase